jgi:nucleoside phosphorylase
MCSVGIGIISEQTDLKSWYRSIGFDMESFAIADTAARYQIPTLVIKSITDIVPERAGLFSMLKLVRSLQNNADRARIQLNRAVEMMIGGYRHDGRSICGYH